MVFSGSGSGPGQGQSSSSSIDVFLPPREWRGHPVAVLVEAVAHGVACLYPPLWAAGLKKSSPAEVAGWSSHSAKLPVDAS